MWAVKYWLSVVREWRYVVRDWLVLRLVGNDTVLINAEIEGHVHLYGERGLYSGCYPNENWNKPIFMMNGRPVMVLVPKDGRLMLATPT